MNWKSLIADLAKAGVSQKAIGEAIGLSQPAVSDLARGRTQRIEWAAGQKLFELHRQHISIDPTVDHENSPKTEVA